MDNLAPFTNDELKSVVMDADVFAFCIQHALSTEKEEIMGLLIGEIDDLHKRAFIKSAMILTRSDKKPDRVEISPEQLYTASAYADHLAEKMRRPWRVIGWYHSHPHITVWPSAVDLHTQGTYQMMDSCFVGLIFSVFPKETKLYKNSVSVCCFQSTKRTQYERRIIRFDIAPSSLSAYNLEGFIQLPKILYEEEMKSHADRTSDQMDNLRMLYNEAIKTVELIHIVSYVGKPLTIDLEERLNATRRRIANLEKLKRRLKAMEAAESME